MPSFLKDLRRRSTKASFNSSDQSSSKESSPYASGTPNSNLSSTKSSSTLSSFFNLTANANQQQQNQHSAEKNQPNGAPTTALPSKSSEALTKRYSMNGTLPKTNGVSNRSTLLPQPSSRLAPQVLSVSDNSWVNQRVLLMYGQIGDPASQLLEGNLIVYSHQESFPSTSWPVCDSHFKALVHLQPGPNRLRLEFIRSRSSNTNVPAHISHININYLPLTSSPPLQLAIILAKDSPATFDAVPERIQKEGNTLEVAVRKFRMAATLWQAFTGEQIYRNGFGRRCFRLEEEWQQSTLSFRDLEAKQMRNEVKVHIIRSEKTVEEIHALENNTQQGVSAENSGLYQVAMDAVKSHFSVQPGHKRYVSCMLLDTHWDSAKKVIKGHAAAGGGDGTIQLAVFGSHSLQSYPTHIEEVVPAFSDCTRTDTTYVTNSSGEAGSNWEAVNMGIGAHLHETGHLFGCPDQESGVMSREYFALNRTFTCREPYSTRTKSPGRRLCLPADECMWHRLDCLRFRFHPCFRLPMDPPPNQDDSVQVWAVDNNSVIVTAASGIAFIELFTEGDNLCHSHIEYPAENGNALPRQVSLNEAELRTHLAEDRPSKRLKLVIHSAGQGKHVIEDFNTLVSKASRVRLPNGQPGFRSNSLGLSQMAGSEPAELILESAVVQTKLLMQVKVYHSSAVEGLEFVYEDSTSQLFGKRGEKAACTEFNLDTRRGEILIGFFVRAGAWIDGIRILTSLGRRSELFGSPASGSGHTLIAPRGYTIAGISGSSAQWLDGFSLIITR